jgi:protein SCO1/2
MIGRWDTRVTLACLAAALTLAACAPAPASDSRRAAAAPRTAADDRDDEAGSLFDLPVALVDQDGRHLSLRDLGGRPLVAAMIYTSCTAVCPRITEDMKAIEAKAGADADVSFVLFSLDPARDTPAALRQFAVDHRLGPRWRLVSASDEGVRDLAAALGIKYNDLKNGEIAHAATIFVLDRNGVITHRQTGLTTDFQPLLAALTRLQHQP